MPAVCERMHACMYHARACRFVGLRRALCISNPLPFLRLHPSILQLCASIYPDFQASSCHEHLCFELTAGARSPARLPPGPPDQSDFDALPPPTPPAAAGSAPRDSAEPPASPPRRAQAPPPLRQKMLLQQQQQLRLQQGGGGGGGSGGGGSAGAVEKPRSPFAFLGGGSPSRERERDRAGSAADVGARRSSSPVPSSANGGSRAGGELGPFALDGEAARPPVPAPAVRGGEGRVGAVSGPQFDVLWRASRGWVLEKVMRRVELPSHVSRHRPPWEKADQGRAQGRRGGGEGAAAETGALARSGSSPMLKSGEVFAGMMPCSSRPK